MAEKEGLLHSNPARSAFGSQKYHPDIFVEPLQSEFQSPLPFNKNKKALNF